MQVSGSGPYLAGFENVTDGGVISVPTGGASGLQTLTLTRNVSQSVGYFLYVGAIDVSPPPYGPNRNSTVLALPANSLDVVAPTLSPCPFLATSLVEQSFVFSATVAEPSDLFVVAVPGGSAPPSVAQVVAGTNPQGGSPTFHTTASLRGTPGPVPAGFTGNATCSLHPKIGNATGEYLGPFTTAVNVSGLVRSTTYDVYTAARDLAGNLPASACKTTVTTPDLTPPVTTFLSAQLQQPSTVQVEVSLDKPGVAFIVMVASNRSAALFPRLFADYHLA